jgi:transposase
MRSGRNPTYPVAQILQATSLGGDLPVLDVLVAERNDATLAEYGDMPAARTGKPRRSAPALCRALKRLGWVRKQRRSGPASRTVWTWQRAERHGATKPPRSTRSASSSSTRAAHGSGFAGPRTGFDTRLNRTHARAPRGLRAHGHAPGGHWRRLILIGALTLDGLCAAMTVAGATDTRVFLAFVTQVLIPLLKQRRPDAVVVMDNPVTSALVTLAAHKAAVVRRALDQAGTAYRYLPACSPDLNPIERAWSKLKAYLRARAARTREALEHAIPEAIATVTPSNAQGWFRQAGYSLN